MTVLIKKSICVDCVWKNSCQSLTRINAMRDSRSNPGHTNDVFEVVIITCSIKNYDRSYKTEGKDGKMYYCTECGQMHHENSRIGINHKTKMEVELQERVKMGS